MMNNNFIRLLSYWAFLVGVIAILDACSSRDNGETIAETKGTTLSVNIAGIADYTTTEPLASNTRSVGANSPSSIIAKEKMVSFDGFDALVSAEKQASFSNTGATDNAVASASSKVVTPMASTTGMDTGKQYRLLIYDATDVNHTSPPVIDVVLTSGSAPGSPIKIDAGKDYNWYAISINQGSVPAVNNGVVDKSGLMNKDVLWAKGTFMAQYGNNNLSITFRRNTTRVQVEVNSLGMFGTINGSPQFDLLAGTNSILKSGDLNVFDGSYANVTAFTATPINYNPTNYTIYTYDLYTIDNTTNIAVNNLNVKLGGFNILKQDYNTVNNTNNNNNQSIVNYSSSTAPINNTSAFTFSQGNSYKVTVKLVESAVTVGGVKWARSNLKGYDGRLGAYANAPFLMADPMNNLDNAFGTSSGNFYWSNLTTDICANVFPKGTWRLPTKADFENIRYANPISVFSANTLSNVNPTGRGNGFFGVQYSDASTVINSGYPQYAQRLVFPIAGYNDNGITSGYNITLNVSKGPMETGYWTKDGNVYGKQRFYTIGNYTYRGSGDPSIYWGGNVTPTSGQQLSIRCVRN